MECYQILLALLENKGWIHHPAVLMWKGHEGCLYRYTVTICQEWADRGYSNLKMDENLLYILQAHGETLKLTSQPPAWLGRAKFHRSHRSNLLRKSSYYDNLGWTEPTTLPYWWPV